MVMVVQEEGGDRHASEAVDAARSDVSRPGLPVYYVCCVLAVEVSVPGYVATFFQHSSIPTSTAPR